MSHSCCAGAQTLLDRKECCFLKNSAFSALPTMFSASSNLPGHSCQFFSAPDFTPRGRKAGPSLLASFPSSHPTGVKELGYFCFLSGAAIGSVLSSSFLGMGEPSPAGGRGVLSVRWRQVYTLAWSRWPLTVAGAKGI